MLRVRRQRDQHFMDQVAPVGSVAPVVILGHQFAVRSVNNKVRQTTQPILHGNWGVPVDLSHALPIDVHFDDNHILAGAV